MKNNKKRLKTLMKAAKILQNKDECRFSCNAVRHFASDLESIKYDKAVGATYNFFSGFSYEEELQYSSWKKQLARQLAVLMYREMIKAGVVK